jgi:hypothetical protein
MAALRAAARPLVFDESRHPDIPDENPADDRRDSMVGSMG